ncbi:MAG TPA: hypothetical protein PL001_00395 [Candidatus Kryptobacter bacterium]|nr:hypothetical protein [Candidatus Kryptobacter bacterium]
MKKYILLLALIAVASTVAILIEGLGNADDYSGGPVDDSIINYLGV